MRCLDLNCCECDMCGGCEVHEHCNEDFNHVVWFTRFASPGEPVCGAMGAPRGYPDRPAPGPPVMVVSSTRTGGATAGQCC